MKNRLLHGVLLVASSSLVLWSGAVPIQAQTGADTPAPSSVDAKIAKARALAANGDCVLAASLVNEVVGTDGVPDSAKAQAYFIAGNCFLEHGSYVGAKLIFKLVLDLPGATEQDKKRAQHGIELAEGYLRLQTPGPVGGSVETDYVKRSLYPARVRSIVLRPSLVLDAAHSIKRSDWTIMFGDALPNAVYYANVGGSPQVEVSDFVCVNSLKERKACSISIPADRKICMLFPGDALRDAVTIVCPVSIEFAR